jgi:hypothetical protein
MTRLRALGIGILLALYGAAGCRTTDFKKDEKAVCEMVFTQPGHKFQSCAKELGLSHLEIQDGVLFFDRDSQIRVKPPRIPGVEPYHAHLFQRVAGQVLDQLFQQDEKGLIEIDLSKYSDPETLVLTSSACDFHEKEVPSRVAKTSPDAKPEEGIAPPYLVSYKLLPADTAETVISLQSFRYDITTSLGVLHVLPQSFNRRDQLITMVDPSRKLSDLMEEDPYVTVAKYETLINPRLTLEVLGKTGKVWERTGTWHVPSGLEKFFKPGEKPFVIRSDEQDLVAFSQPPTLDLSFPDDAPGMSARVAVKFRGMSEKDHLKVVLGCVYPSGPKGEFSAKMQSHDVPGRAKDETYSVSLEGLPAEAFPLTASVTHRLVQPWRLTGGRYDPQEPRGKSTLASIEKRPDRRGPSHVIFARYASHFDFLLFFGAGNGGKRKSSLADSYYQGGGSATPPSSNMLPPTDPPGGGPLPPIILPPIVNPAGPGGQAGGGGGPGGGGPDSDCGCGPRGAGCPSQDHKCGGHCGHCRCQGKQDGSITIQLTCTMKGVGCQPEDQCKCGTHGWNENDCTATINSLFPKAAEWAWFGDRGGVSACHVATPVARLRVTYWGVGAAQFSVWYTVSIDFQPCTPKPKDPPPPDKPVPGGKGKPGIGGDGGAGGGMGKIIQPTNLPTGFDPTGGTTGTTGQTTQITNHPYNDPNMGLRGQQISNTLGGYGQVGSSVIIPVDLYSPVTFASFIDLLNNDYIDFQSAYWPNPMDTSPNPMMGLSPDLPSFWGKPNPGPAPAKGPAGGTSAGTTAGTS